jgi:dedicator of cytokinesis protein 3
VQVTVELRRQDGTVISDAIFAGGTGEPATPFYHSLVFTNTDKPTFGEMIKVSLPPRAEECHLFLTFRSRGKEKGLADISELERPFACAYLPLVQDSACIKDGSHDLILYHMEKNLQGAPHLYYDSPSADATHGDGATATKNMTPLKDRISLRTYLCSNVHTQDDTLRALFHCQSRLSDLESIATMLQRFAFVSEDELSKFIPRTLDSLFGILVSNFGERQDELDDLVFQSLSKVLAMSSDRRFGGFAGLLETYITFHFNYPASSFHLLRAMKTVMSRPERKEYRSFLKVWHLFFRFIIRSRELDRARGIGLDATSRHIAADFQRQTKAILGEINTLMMSSDKSLIGTQTLAVQHYADILPDMAQVFPPLEIAELVIAFADTLTFAEGSIALYKLLLLLQVVKSVFDTSEARALLVPAIVRWVKPHLGRMDAVYVKGSSEAEDNRRVKWLECNRLAVTVSRRKPADH